jgi:magnesium chelatase family protein
LLSIDDLEAPLFVVENHGLPVGADHQVIGVRHDKGLLIAEHNPNRSKGFSVHQFFDLVCDHALESSRRRPAKAISFFSSFAFGRTAINLALGDVRKEGPSFDLPTGLAILAASEQIESDQPDRFTMLGELALDGRVRPVKGVLPIALRARQEGKTGVLVPAENGPEAAVVEARFSLRSRLAVAQF